MRRMTAVVVASAVVLTIAACSGSSAGEPSAEASASAAASGSPITVEPLDGAGGEAVEVAGVRLDVPSGLEARETSDGTTQKVSLHEPGRDRAVLVLGVTPEDDGVTDGDVDVARTVTAHQLEAAGYSDDVESHPVTWSALGYGTALSLDLAVDGETYDVLWLAGRDPDATRLVTVHVESDEGTDVRSTLAYEALRTLQFT